MTKRSAKWRQAAPAEEVGIDLRATEHYEAGAVLLTLLAYPDAKDEPARARLHRTLCHLYLRARAEEDEAWPCRPQTFKPIYAFVDPLDVQRDLRTFKRRLRDRMIAARMAIAYLKQQVQGDQFKLPRNLKSIALQQLSELVIDDLHGIDEANIDTRIWRPTRPVMHLAVAVQLALDQIKVPAPQADSQTSVNHGQFHIGHILNEPGLVKLLLAGAAEMAELMRQNDRMPIDANSLMQIRVKE